MANTSILVAFERMWQHVVSALSKKSDISHNHDDMYYTETEVDSKVSAINTSISNVNESITNVVNGATKVGKATTADSATSATNATKDGNGKVISSTYETKTDASSKLTEAKTYTDTVASGKADSNHNHDSDYDAIGSANDALASAKSYTNTKTASLASTTVVDNKISSHNTSTSAHNDIRALITDLTTKLNNFLDVDDTTTDQLSEVLTLIENNKDTLESLTSSKVNVSDIIDNLTTSSTSKVLSANQGVVIKGLIDALQEELDSHTHTIADVSGLQSALNGKAASSHGTHVTYSSTAPVMDGTASVGSASTVARSDHRHPTDTSRASKTEFDTHTSDTTAHITSTERTNWNAAKTHADSAHAPSNAEKNQNAFSNIAVSGQTTVAADTTTDTVTFVGSNVSITTDATNDKVTFTVANGTTSAKGVVQLTNSTSSTSTTTAATPSSVKSAYDLANTAKTNAATAQTKADNAYTLAEGKVDSLSDLGITATATELNYVDGVTSNVQTQLNAVVSTLSNKSDTSHNHDDMYYTETEVDSKISHINTSISVVDASVTNIINGTTTVGKATSADSATTATKLGSSTLGSSTKPIYLNSGTATACSTYAGGTAVTLNGSSKAASTAKFYAPTSVGTSGYILKSSGSGAPAWLSTLPLVNGGTGATTATAALSNLGVTSGTWTPEFHGGGSPTVTSYGNYIKINNLVVLDFFLHVEGTLANSTSSIYIDGFPYVPDLSARTWYGGGGFLQGFQVGSGYTDATFGGYVISLVSSEARLYPRSSYSTDALNNGGYYIRKPETANGYMSGTIMYYTAS